MLFGFACLLAGEVVLLVFILCLNVDFGLFCFVFIGLINCTCFIWYGCLCVTSLCYFV